MEDQRLGDNPGREDFSSPYSRDGEGLNSATKSSQIGGGGSGAYRWSMALGGEANLSRPFAQHPWVYSCVSAIARAASSVPARLQRRMSGGQTEADEDGPLALLLNAPNPLQSQRKFLRAIATSQQLYGETFLLMLKHSPKGMVPVEATGGYGMSSQVEMPDEIWPVRGDLAEAVLDEATKLPAAWRFRTSTGSTEYPAHSVVQIAEVNPYNPLRGMGPMQAAFRTASKDFIVDRYDEALLQNGGSPGGVLSVDGPLTDGDQRAIRDAWQEAHGRADQHRKTAVLPQGTNYQEIGMTPQAMEHEKLREWNRQTLLSIFGVPPVVLGIESMNYATAREQNRIFWETTILPYLDFLRDELQYKLLRRLPKPTSGLLLDFDISGVSALREDVDAKVDRSLKLYEKGHRSFSEAASLAGWDITDEELEGRDDRYVPTGVALAGELPHHGGETPPEEPKKAKPEAKAAPETDESGSDWPDWLATEESREAYFRSYTASQDDAVAQISRRTKRVMREMMLFARKKVRSVAKSSAAGKSSGGTVTKAVITEAEILRMLGLQNDVWGEELDRAITPALKGVMVEGAALLAKEISVQLIISTVEDPFILEFYAKQPVYLAEGPLSTLAKNVHRAILDAVTAPGVGSYSSLAEAIRGELQAIEGKLTGIIDGLGPRADRIAATETAKAHNGARVQEMKLNGVERHKWLSSRDEFVRDTHSPLGGVDGQVRKVGEPFSNGVIYPASGGSAPAGEVVNCRCTTVAQKAKKPKK